MRLVRSQHSVGLVGSNIHLFVFKPTMDHGVASCWGFHLRQRRKNYWRHTILRLFQRGRVVREGTRATCTWELQQYLSTKPKASDRGDKNRLTYKRFVRFKVGFGGWKPEVAE